MTGFSFPLPAQAVGKSGTLTLNSGFHLLEGNYFAAFCYCSIISPLVL